VNWQLWMTTGDKPLPLRYVVITKWFTGSAKCMLQLRKFNAVPQTDAARFIFVRSQDAQELDPASVTVNATGDMPIREK
jgi:hypothetical protein